MAERDEEDTVLQRMGHNLVRGGWVGLPVLGHVPRHVLQHVPGRHVLKHVSKHVLRHLPDKHMPKNVLKQMALAVLMT